MALLKLQQKDLLEILSEALDLIQPEEERNKKFEEVEDEEDKELDKEHVEEKLQRASLFQSPKHKVR
jgi:hypothetical protein